MGHFCFWLVFRLLYINMIEINNLTDFSVDKRFFKGVAKVILKGENKELEDLSIAFVSPEEIRKINRKYRKKDRPTDVLSFEKNLKIKEDFLEVVICPQIVKEKTIESRLSLKQELTKSLIHGILHSIGYGHEVSKKEAKRMEKKEEYYLSSI